jgi:hypothetical protein
MPKIELTDEQAEELRDALEVEMERLDRRLRKFPRADNDPDVLQVKHVRSILSDILHLLEIE